MVVGVRTSGLGTLDNACKTAAALEVDRHKAAWKGRAAGPEVGLTLRRPQGDFFHVLHALALNVRRRHHVTPRTFGHTLLPPYPESSPPIYPSAPGPYRWTEGLHPQHGGATLYEYVMDRVKTRLAADFEGARLRCTSVLTTHLTGGMIERLGSTH